MDKDLKYVLELSTVFNVIFPFSQFQIMPTHYLTGNMVKYSLIGEFREYYPCYIKNEFETHLSITSRIEDANIRNDINCVFYIPSDSHTKQEARKYFEVSVENIERSKTVAEVLFWLIHIHMYDFVYC
jgi:hypothetical protein